MKRHDKRNSKILVWVDGTAFGRYRMPNRFWSWTRKARAKYAAKRWPNASCLHNATPPGMSGRKLQWLNSTKLSA